jgi:hypothetical protein
MFDKKVKNCGMGFALRRSRSRTLPDFRSRGGELAGGAAPIWCSLVQVIDNGCLRPHVK